jgi:hypothetical protein
MMMTTTLGARVKEGWMAGMPPLPENRRRISGAYLSLIEVSFSELRKDLTLLVDSRWAEAVRRRAEELSSTLAKACARQQLDEVAAVARALANLTRISRANALPVLPAMKEKFDALMRDATTLLSAVSKRGLG